MWCTTVLGAQPLGLLTVKSTECALRFLPFTLKQKILAILNGLMTTFDG